MNQLTDLILQYLTALWTMLFEMSPYLLLGFVIAGVLQAFVPRQLYARHLGSNTMGSVIKSALFGIPLPLCSCGVIPTAVSLRREGASKGACVSFLISTPQTGVDSIMATYSMLGLPFAILRPFVALVTALLGGGLVNAFDVHTVDSASSPAIVRHESQTEPRSFAARCRQALHYGLVEMLQDVGKWFVIGLLLAALITVLVPEGFFTGVADKPWLSMPIVLLLSMPMYLCATGSIPIAVSLMLKGLSPGAALVLLMAGPATNMASILVVSKVFGRRTSALYLLSIVVGAVFFGTCIDLFLPASWFAVRDVLPQSCCGEVAEGGASWFEWGCALLFVGCLIHAFALRYWGKGESCHCGCHGEETSCSCGCDDDDDDDCHCCSCHEGECSCSCHSEKIGNEVVPQEQVFQISGMKCNHCRSHVEEAIASIDGVTVVRVDLASGMAHVEGSAPREVIVSEIEKLGYKVIS